MASSSATRPRPPRSCSRKSTTLYSPRGSVPARARAPARGWVAPEPEAVASAACAAPACVPCPTAGQPQRRGATHPPCPRGSATTWPGTRRSPRSRRSPRPPPTPCPPPRPARGEGPGSSGVGGSAPRRACACAARPPPSTTPARLLGLVPQRLEVGLQLVWRDASVVVGVQRLKGGPQLALLVLARVTLLRRGGGGGGEAGLGGHVGPRHASQLPARTLLSSVAMAGGCRAERGRVVRPGSTAAISPRWRSAIGRASRKQKNGASGSRRQAVAGRRRRRATVAD